MVQSEKVSKASHEAKKGTAKCLYIGTVCMIVYRFRATCEVVWQYPDLRIGGLVYDTLSLMYAEFQRAKVRSSSHQSL